MADAHRTWAYQQDRARLRDKRITQCQCLDGCIYPGQPIRYDLPYPHPLSFSAEHVIPVRVSGGHVGPLLPAHLGCQRRQGARAAHEVTSIVRPRSSGAW